MTVATRMLALFVLVLGGHAADVAEPKTAPPKEIAPHFAPPAEFAKDFGKYGSLLRFADGHEAKTAADWAARRQEIKAYWDKILGQWPALLEKPKLEYVQSEPRDNFIQHRVRVEIAPGQLADGYLLVPKGGGPLPGVVVPYYEPESSIGTSKTKLRDFAYQLAKRGFVTISIGSPGGDSRKPETGQAAWQPLSFLAYVAANCANALANVKGVDPKRIGVVGHSYGGKWAMFAAALHDKFACGVWSDPGIVFDESRPNINYWEPWYIGFDPKQTRKPGVPNAENPRTGPYKQLYDTGHDLHEIMALIATRPFLVSGGSEDPPERWQALNRVNEAYQLLGKPNRVAMTNRPKHDPTEESNEIIYRFFEWALK